MNKWENRGLKGELQRAVKEVKPGEGSGAALARCRELAMQVGGGADSGVAVQCADTGRCAERHCGVVIAGQPALPVHLLPAISV